MKRFTFCPLSSQSSQDVTCQWAGLYSANMGTENLAAGSTVALLMDAPVTTSDFPGGCVGTLKRGRCSARDVECKLRVNVSLTEECRENNLMYDRTAW